VHTAATTGHNIHEMNIDRNGPILQDFIVDSPKGAGIAPTLFPQKLRKSWGNPWKRAE
jgi:hypothetical protein